MVILDVVESACPGANELCTFSHCSHPNHPQHVLGLGLSDLSMAQLDALELLHHTALTRYELSAGWGEEERGKGQDIRIKRMSWLDCDRRVWVI